MKRLALAAMLLAAPAMAQDSAPETIEVIAPRTLAGIWKIHFPGGISMYVPTLGRGTFAGYDSFCRIEQAEAALVIRCLPWNGSGTASLEDGRLHLAWGVALFRFVIDAPIVTTTAFTGAYKLKTFGDSHEAPTLASGRKLAPSGDTLDTAGQAEALRKTLQAIASGAAPAQNEADRRNFGTLFGGAPATWSDWLRDAGPPAHVIYLGASSPPATWAESVRDASPSAGKSTAKQSAVTFEFHDFSLYDVEFANGQRLRGVHTGEDGKVDDILCV